MEAFESVEKCFEGLVKQIESCSSPDQIPSLRDPLEAVLSMRRVNTSNYHNNNCFQILGDVPLPEGVQYCKPELTHSNPKFVEFKLKMDACFFEIRHKISKIIKELHAGSDQHESVEHMRKYIVLCKQISELPGVNI